MIAVSRFLLLVACTKLLLLDPLVAVAARAAPTSGAVAPGTDASGASSGDSCRTVSSPGSGPSVQDGIASWYGREFQGYRTASGERFDPNAMTAAHRTLPLGSYARVTVTSSSRSVIVRINDRGPFVRNRIVDLSYAAARALGIAGRGSARVTIAPARPLSCLESARSWRYRSRTECAPCRA